MLKAIKEKERLSNWIIKMASKRMLSKNICTSDKIIQLTWFQEVLYYRILVNADDYGCFYFSEATIKEMCFPGKQCSLKTLREGRNILCSLDLLAIGSHNNCKFLAIKGWDKFQKLRSDRSKYSLFGMTNGMTDEMLQRHTVDYRVKSIVFKSIDTASADPNKYFAFLNTFGEVYKAKTGHDYRKTGKDWGLVKDLLDKNSYDQVVEKAKLLFELCQRGDIWFAKSMADFTIGTLSAQWNRIIPEVRSNGKQAGVSESELASFMQGRE